MTLTLELPIEIESRLEEEARSRGVAAATVAGEVLRVWAHGKVTTGTSNSDSSVQKPLSARQQAALDGYGKYAGRSRTSDDLIRERREEAKAEMQQTAQRKMGDFS